jgi:hypothetical protein
VVVMKVMTKREVWMSTSLRVMFMDKIRKEEKEMPGLLHEMF